MTTDYGKFLTDFKTVIRHDVVSRIMSKISDGYHSHEAYEAVSYHLYTYRSSFDETRIILRDFIDKYFLSYNAAPKLPITLLYDYLSDLKKLLIAALVMERAILTRNPELIRRDRIDNIPISYAILARILTEASRTWPEIKKTVHTQHKFNCQDGDVILAHINPPQKEPSTHTTNSGDNYGCTEC